MKNQWVLLGILLGLAATASATDLGVSPTRVSLNPARPSSTLTLTNGEAREVLFEVSAHQWKMTPSGKWEETPTTLLRVFPPQIKLGPKGQAVLRMSHQPVVGLTSELTYRIHLQELPRKHEGGDSKIQLLTKISLPVFLVPPGAKLALSVPSVSWRAGKLVVSVKNAGQLHLHPQSVQATWEGRGGKSTTSTGAPYVLPGSMAEWAIDPPVGGCSGLSALELNLTESKATLHIPLTARCQ